MREFILKLKPVTFYVVIYYYYFFFLLQIGYLEGNDPKMTLKNQGSRILFYSHYLFSYSELVFESMEQLGKLFSEFLDQI